MPSLRKGEYMHVCESDICARTTGGSRAGKPRPYIVRTYYNDIEKHYCQTCCQIKTRVGVTESKYDSNGNWKGYALSKKDAPL